jgi:hypothetical protein
VIALLTSSPQGLRPGPGGRCLEACAQRLSQWALQILAQTKNVVESELILLGTDYDNEGKPIAYLRKEAAGELKFAGTAFLTISGKARDELQQCIEKLVTERPPVPQRIWRKPQWLKPELRVRVKHLAGGDALRHGSVRHIVEE